MQFIIQNLNFHIPHTKVQFSNLNLSFTKQKYGLVGDNGIGKTSFFKLLSGELLPHSGRILVPHYSYLKQEPQNTQSIAEMLEISPILQALKRIQMGSTEENDFDLVQNHWDLEEKINQLLQEWGMDYLELSTHFQTLSGGEQTKIQIIKAMLSNAELILLDEPSNHLDKKSRLKLMEWIEASKQCFVIISHDKALLNQMDAILELSTKGFKLYGGNYDFYCAQQDIEKAALSHKISQATRHLSGIQENKQEMLEKKSQAVSLKKSKEKDKILKGFQKNKSEQSKSKLIQASDSRLTAATEELKILQSQLEIKEKIKIALPKTEVPKQKLVLKIENLDFAYPNQERLFHHFNLIITGPERLAIQGDNGSGKSSLAKIIMQRLIPQQGSVCLGVNQIQYLSQFSDFMDEELSILDNFLIKNPDLSTQEAYARLAQFNFRNIQTQKIIKHLSGGEKIRAGLAASLLSNQPPQLLILDEPNNHLDIESLEAITDILKLYQGAIIVISHDEIFLNQINIQRIISI